MKCNFWMLTLSMIFVFALGLECAGQEFSKRIIELPVKELIGAKKHLAKLPATETEQKFDITKLLIENPVKNLAKFELMEEQFELMNASENQACQPGLVQWHKDLETARAASETSGKPILLFQLLGNLDQRFT